MKKLFIVSFILFVGVFLYGCRDGGSGGNFVPTQIVVERIEISHPQTNFPTIKLKNVSGQERTASVDDFWFVAENEYVFVQNGRIVITRDAPTTFIENLTITLRSNIQISTTVEVERLYVPVESLGFTINRHSFSILRGESAKLGVTFNPSHASNQNATFSIVSATVGYHNIHDYATITPEGFIEIDSFLEAGVVIKIRATVTGTDVYSDIDLEVRSRMPIFAVSGANGFNTTLRNNPFGDFVLTADINLGSIVRWNPISIFHGTIEGNGHTISNIRIVETGRRLNSDLYLGLFGHMVGEIRNLNVDGVHIEWTYSEAGIVQGRGFVYAGAVSAVLVGTLENIEVRNVHIAIDRHLSFTGGVVGLFVGENCRSFYNGKRPCKMVDIRVLADETFFILGRGDVGGAIGVAFGGTYIKNILVDGLSEGGEKMSIVKISYDGFWISAGGIAGQTTRIQWMNRNRVTEVFIDNVEVRNVLFRLWGSKEVPVNMGYVIGQRNSNDYIIITNARASDNERSIYLNVGEGDVWEEFYFRHSNGFYGRVWAQ